MKDLERLRKLAELGDDDAVEHLKREERRRGEVRHQPNTIATIVRGIHALGESIRSFSVPKEVMHHMRAMTGAGRRRKP